MPHAAKPSNALQCETRVAVPAAVFRKSIRRQRNRLVTKPKTRRRPQRKQPSLPILEDFLDVTRRGAARRSDRIQCLAFVRNAASTCRKWTRRKRNVPSAVLTSNRAELVLVKSRIKTVERAPPDLADFFPGLVKSSWKFVLKNQMLAWRTDVYTLVCLLISGFCAFMYLWISAVPPRAFFAMCFFVSFLVIPGWLWNLDTEVIKLTLERKDKFKKLNFDFFLASAKRRDVRGLAGAW